MENTINYTTLFAPVAFYLGGVVIIFMLNKFIGKTKTEQ
ncbi:hypothetical protein Ptc2401_00212 [Prosthecochloris sp. CIB 2401]|nr:hypothetical protein Ptc2401_00212 [Prosthecochloris sp. CIB 2401]